MSITYDCDFKQGLCLPFSGRGGTFRTPEECSTSCSKYCFLPKIVINQDGKRTVKPGTACKKQLVEYFDARRSPGCPANMLECQTQFHPVTGERHAGMSHRMSHGMNYKLGQVNVGGKTCTQGQDECAAKGYPGAHCENGKCMYQVQGGRPTQLYYYMPMSGTRKTSKLSYGGPPCDAIPADSGYVGSYYCTDDWPCYYKQTSECSWV